MNDPINPNHYKQGGLESIDAIKAFMSEEAFKGFLKGFRLYTQNGGEVSGPSCFFLQFSSKYQNRVLH